MKAQLHSRIQKRKFRLIALAFLLLPGCSNHSGQSGQKAGEESKTQGPEISSGEVLIGEKVYPTLTVNSTTWLAQNLTEEVAESWCYLNAPSNCQQSGRLYRWQAAKEACRSLGEDWQLPSDKDWQELALAFGGYFDWLADKDVGDPAAANRALLQGDPGEQRSGFNARLGGWRGSNGGYDSQGTMGFYWSSSEANEDEAWFYIFLPDRGKLNRRNTKKAMGMSCRCIRK